MEKLISIIIPNFNGAAFLGDCLGSLAGQTCKNFEIILVDNGSTDNSVELAQELCPGIRLILNDENRGFAAANNQGLEIARGKYIATLNNDTVVEPKWLENLVARAGEYPGTGMCAPKILLHGKERVIDSVGINIAPDGMTRQRGRMEIDRGQYDRPEEVLFPSACSALYSRDMLEETGFFDEDFFAYCEDSDLGLRARLAGWKACSAPEAVVYHRYSGTGGAYSLFKAYLVERNHFYVALKNFPAALLLFLPLFTLYRYVLQVVSIIEGEGSGAEFSRQVPFSEIIKTVLRAHVEVILTLPKTLGKRRMIQKGRKINSRDFLELIRKHKLSFTELVFRK